MCFSGGDNAVDKDALAKASVDQRRAYKMVRNGADWDATDVVGPSGASLLGQKPADFDTWSIEKKHAYFDEKAPRYDGYWKMQLGDDYIDPKTGRKIGAPPPAPDLTDNLIAQTRTSMALRLQAGKNQKSSFTGTQLGGLDLSRPVLGGY